MDVVLLSRMIGELMPDLDSLSLPGLGTFRAEQVGASFSDKGFTVNPPYRRLGFSATQTDDGRLAALYASSNGVSQTEASAILQAFTARLAAELRDRKTVELPGLGRLRATREDHFFFVPDEDLDISPDACGLVSVSLKSHVSAPFATSAGAERPLDGIGPYELTARGLSAGADSIDAGPKEPAGAGKGSDGIGPYELTAESLPAGAGSIEKEPVKSAGADEGSDGVGPYELTAEPSSAGADVKPEPTVKPTDKPKAVRQPLRWYHWTGIAVAAVALLLAGFVALSRIAPDFTDRLLYTPDQLSIINAPEDGTCLPG